MKWKSLCVIGLPLSCIGSDIVVSIERLYAVVQLAKRWKADNACAFSKIGVCRRHHFALMWTYEPLYWVGIC